MSTNGKQRRRMGRDPWREKPGFTTYYMIGVEVSKQLPTRKSLDEIGRHFGITKQNAYTEMVVALGKLCYQLREIRRQEMAKIQ